MEQKSKVLLLCSIIVHINTGFSDFLGGTISWMQDISTNSIRFTYRLTWENATGPCGPNCSPAQKGTNMTGLVNSSLLAGLSWKYSDGVTSRNVSGVNYYVTSVSRFSTLGWEQGENLFTITASQTHKTQVVFLDTIPWKRSVSETKSAIGYMETSFDLRIRNDTGKANISPYVSLPPFLGVSFGRTTRIRLPADDPDGDFVRCRWATRSECKQACTSTPIDAIKLSKANCTLTINAYNETGFQPHAIYRLAIVVEDFPHGLTDVGGETFTRSKPLSRVPLQFILKTTLGDGDCNNQESHFIDPFAGFNIRTYFDPSKSPKIVVSVSLETDELNITDFMASVPRFTSYRPRMAPSFYVKNTQIDITLKPAPSQSGYIQFCFWVLRSDGVITDAACSIDTVMDTFHCNKSFCQNGGSCVNRYNVTKEACDCPERYKPPDCSTEVTCSDQPCENRGFCKPNGSIAFCSCNSGYKGIYCDQEPDHCASSPCNNNGTCLDLQNYYICLCSAKFTGSNCEELENDHTKMLPSNQDKVPVWIPVTVSIGGLLSLVGLSVCIYKLKPANSTSNNSARSSVKQRKSNVTKVKPVTVEYTGSDSVDF